MKMLFPEKNTSNVIHTTVHTFCSLLLQVRIYPWVHHGRVSWYCDNKTDILFVISALSSLPEPVEFFPIPIPKC